MGKFISEWALLLRDRGREGLVLVDKASTLVWLMWGNHRVIVTRVKVVALTHILIREIYFRNNRLVLWNIWRVWIWPER